jgi:hypothetical protein
MRNLVTIDKNREDFYHNIPVSEAQEAKITGLIRAKKLPETFTIAGTPIKRSTILGFSATPIKNKPVQKKLKFSSAEEFFAWGRTQKWYKPRVAAESAR